jgi:hypothetical protein
MFQRQISAVGPIRMIQVVMPLLNLIAHVAISKVVV